MNHAPATARGAGYVLPLYAFTLFLSAFLLFAVQPMFTKMVLPLLGGSAAVWNTAVVFFQGTLLLGYLYAHLSTRLLGLRRQTILHGVVLLLAFVALPIGVASGWTPPSEGLQVTWLLGLLAVSIGLPFFAVSATAPLLQKWFAHTDHPSAADPYFLYGGSNLGSLAALLSYPFLIEPALGLRAQGVAWTCGYAGLVAAIATCAVILVRRFRAEGPREQQGSITDLRDQSGKVLQHHVTWRLRARWFALSVVPSGLLLGVTLHIGTNIAAAPFLWVLPLALYLLTFVLVFARRPLFSPGWMLGAQVVFVAPAAILYGSQNLYALVALHIGTMFFTAMVCHGELARQRPTAAHLTEFYLWMSIGGVVGGFLAGIVAPLVFAGVYEYPIALLLGLLLRPAPDGEGRLSRALARLTRADRSARLWKLQDRVLDVALPLLLWLALDRDRLSSVVGASTAWLLERYQGAEGLASETIRTLAFLFTVTALFVWLAQRPLRAALGLFAVFYALSPGVLGRPKPEENQLLRARSFFGVYTVNAKYTKLGRFHYLANGAITHGGQNLDRPLGPITYYFREGPVGQFFDILKDSPAPGRRMGVIGLGVGGLACYVTHGQHMTYYEIDPLDERIARDPRFFTYLGDAGERVDVVIGDGRLSLAKEQDGTFDALIVDAFTGDAIPAHLLTREAFALYFRKLTEHGLLLVHITNGYLDLLPVVSNLAADAGLALRYSTGVAPTSTPGAELSDWVVLARKPEMLARFGWISTPWTVPEPDPDVDVWTDNFTNVAQVIRWQSFTSLSR